MKRLGMILVALATLLIATGCNSSKTYTTTENNVTVDEPYEVPDGLAIIVDSSDNATIMVDEDIITIDCGSGGCGDINIGVEGI